MTCFILKQANQLKENLVNTLIDQLAQRIGEIFLVGGTLSILVQQALQVLFDYEPINNFLKGKKLKFPIAFLTSVILCNQGSVDFFANLFNSSSNWYTLGMSALLVAGGSYTWIRLFGDFYNLKKVKEEKEADA